MQEGAARKGYLGARVQNEKCSSSATSTGSIPDNKPLVSSTAVQDILGATSKLQGPELANAVKNLQALFSTFSIQSTPAKKSSVDMSRNSYYDDLCLIDFSSPKPIENPMSLIDPDLEVSSVEAPIVFPDLSEGSSMADSPVMSANGAHRDSLHMVSIRSSSSRSHSVYEEVQLAGSQLVPALGERVTVQSSISPVEETPFALPSVYEEVQLAGSQLVPAWVNGNSPVVNLSSRRNSSQ
uniref:Uncharacterized protein n=1 Tax=Ditylenchus dipsaci TaxID=166011 RepID=A0A915ERE7_9BILA